MANEIREKFTSPASLTLTLASLGSSTAGVGRQSTLVDNSTTGHKRIYIFLKVKQGTSPTGNRGVYVYAIRGNGTIRSDQAGASDGALTVTNAQLLGVMRNAASPSTGDVLQGDIIFDDPGREWGICVVHDTGVALDSTEGNHAYSWVGDLPEVQ